MQEIQGKINPGEIDVFVLSGLKQGQTLFVTLETTSGNLDPVLSLVPASVDLPTLIATTGLKCSSWCRPQSTRWPSCRP